MKTYKVVCTEDVLLDETEFKRGKIYNYYVDYIENLCDEYICREIDNIPISNYLFRSYFEPLNDWRNNQIQKAIGDSY